MICPTLLSDTRLYEALLKFDGDIAEKAREARCPGCGGALHSARYPRKPRGSTAPLPEGYAKRDSLCCAEDGCRRRVTPPSVRFLGRKVYLGVVIVVVTAMKHGVTHGRAATMARAVGVSRETLARWRRWWAELFVKTPFWSAAQSFFAPPVVTTDLPASLLARFAGDHTATQVEKLLAFIRPVTTRSAPAMAGILMGS
jgi:hypothetical protein